MILDLEAAGNYVAVRPSGTEPKVKFYMFAYDPPQDGEDLAARKPAQADRIAALTDARPSSAGVYSRARACCPRGNSRGKTPPLR